MLMTVIRLACRLRRRPGSSRPMLRPKCREFLPHGAAGRLYGGKIGHIPGTGSAAGVRTRSACVASNSAHKKIENETIRQCRFFLENVSQQIELENRNGISPGPHSERENVVVEIYRRAKKKKFFSLPNPSIYDGDIFRVEKYFHYVIGGVGAAALRADVATLLVGRVLFLP